MKLSDVLFGFISIECPQAKPHIQTFRTNKAKSDAFGNQETDKIARQGDFGTGIYEPAKN